MNIQENYQLLEHNTFHLPCIARYFAEYQTVEELCQLLTQFRGEQLLHIGGGSNMVLPTEYRGLVLHSQIRFLEPLHNGLVRVGSGVIFDEFIKQTLEMGLAGAENLSYIPGEVGASAVQNIGAYGVEAKDIIRQVETIEIETLQKKVFDVEDCKYGYRDSIFKNELKDKYIVTAVVFALTPQESYTPRIDYGNLRSRLQEHPTAQQVRDAVIQVRREKLPEVSELGSAGSFFKNPIVSQEDFEALHNQYPQMPYYEQDGGYKIPAAWLIENSGLKGFSVGGAKVYEKQPLVIVNTGHATTDDVYFLSAVIHDSVIIDFGIELECEAMFVYDNLMF